MLKKIISVVIIVAMIAVALPFNAVAERDATHLQQEEHLTFELPVNEDDGILEPSNESPNMIVPDYEEESQHPQPHGIMSFLSPFVPFSIRHETVDTFDQLAAAVVSGGTVFITITGTITMRHTLEILPGRHIELLGGTLIAPPNARHFNVRGSLLLDNGNTLRGAGSNNSGGVLVLGNGTFNMLYSTRIHGVRRSTYGGAVTLQGTSSTSRAIFNMRGGIIDDNQASSGAGVNIGVFGTMNMWAGEIRNNRSTQNYYYWSGGGGVRLNTTTSQFYMHGGWIHNNTAVHSGGGVLVAQQGGGASFTMYGGTISNNNAGRGGGVALVSPGSIVRFVMRDGMIHDNRATFLGGGVQVDQGGLFHMLDGNITSNTTTGSWDNTHGGGGVNVSGDARAQFLMLGGTICNNRAHTGGGVRIGPNGSMVMEDGTISHNTAIVNSGGYGRGGGGIAVLATQTVIRGTRGFYMVAGNIEGNIARNGGGISTSLYSEATTVPASAYGNMRIYSGAIFSGNIARENPNGASGTSRASAPPLNANNMPTITRFNRGSRWHSTLNNYDIKYVGRMNVTPIACCEHDVTRHRMEFVRGLVNGGERYVCQDCGFYAMPPELQDRYILTHGNDFEIVISSIAYIAVLEAQARQFRTGSPSQRLMVPIIEHRIVSLHALIATTRQQPRYRDQFEFRGAGGHYHTDRCTLFPAIVTQGTVNLVDYHLLYSGVLEFGFMAAMAKLSPGGALIYAYLGFMLNGNVMGAAGILADSIEFYSIGAAQVSMKRLSLALSLASIYFHYSRTNIEIGDTRIRIQSTVDSRIVNPAISDFIFDSNGQFVAAVLG